MKKLNIKDKLFLQLSTTGKALIVTFEGNIGPDHLPEIESYFIKNILSMPQKEVILNLSKIKYLSSLVLGFFLKIYKELNSSKRVLKIAAASKSLNELFIITNINSVISIYDSLEKALDSVNLPGPGQGNIPGSAPSASGPSGFAFPVSGPSASGSDYSGSDYSGPDHTGPNSQTQGFKNAPASMLCPGSSGSRFLCDIKIEITSISYFVKIVRESLRLAVSENYEITPEEEMDLLLCLGESVNNAIKHGYLDRQTQGKVQIWVLFFSDRVVVAVEDFGAGFNEEKILCKAMQAPENIAGLSGRGIFIINSLMDNAIHRSNEESSSTSIFIKFLQIKSDAHILEQAREV